MTNRFQKLILPAAMVTALALPAAAQIPIPEVEIHVAHTAPPHLRHEHRPPSPGEGYVWIGGAWGWQGNQWTWAPGRWERPEGHVRWIRPRYTHEYGAYRYEPGHWSNQHLVESEDYRRWHEEKRHHHDDHDANGDHGRSGGDHDRQF
jgi:hypothetical protein